MPNPIVPKSNATAGTIPAAASLLLGELAACTGDGELFLRLANGTVVNIGGQNRLKRGGDSMTGTLGVRAVTDTVTTVSPVAGVVTLDLSQGQEFLVNLTGNVTSFTLSNVPAGAFAFSVSLRQDATGGRTVAWTLTGRTVVWAGGTAPTMTATASREDEVLFKTRNGTAFKAYVAGQNWAT